MAMYLSMVTDSVRSAEPTLGFIIVSMIAFSITTIIFKFINKYYSSFIFQCQDGGIFWLVFTCLHEQIHNTWAL